MTTFYLKCWQFYNTKSADILKFQRLCTGFSCNLHLTIYNVVYDQTYHNQLIFDPMIILDHLWSRLPFVDNKNGRVHYIGKYAWSIVAPCYDIPYVCIWNILLEANLKWSNMSSNRKKNVIAILNTDCLSWPITLTLLPHRSKWPAGPGSYSD